MALYTKLFLLYLLGCAFSEMHNHFNSIEYYYRCQWFILPPEKQYCPYVVYYVRDVGEDLKQLCWLYGTMILAKRIDFKAYYLVTIFFLFGIFDLIMFFINYKTYGYVVVYYLVIGLGCMPIIAGVMWDGILSDLRIYYYKKSIAFKKCSSFIKTKFKTK